MSNTVNYYTFAPGWQTPVSEASFLCNVTIDFAVERAVNKAAKVVKLRITSEHQGVVMSSIGGFFDKTNMRLTNPRLRTCFALLLATIVVGTGLWAAGTVTYYATYKLDGGTATQNNQTYTATATDTSAVWVTNSGSLTLTNPTITTSGNTSSQENSSFYGLNAGLLATAAGKVTVTGGTITTTGTGANGAFATGAGSSVTLTDVTIKASADGGHAVMATQAGTVNLTNVNMTTLGGSSSAVATDRGGGTITVTGGTVNTAGGNSAGIYSTGAITATGTTFKATGAEMAVIEGANSITLNDCGLTTTKEKWGVMIYQSMSGDAQGAQGTYTMTGGSLTYAPASGPLFYVTNSTGIIKLTGVTVTKNSGVLVKASAGNWGNSGSNGGTVILTASGQTMRGDMTADNISSITATFKDGSYLTGAINTANTAKAVSLTLDSTSVWSLTANSYLTTLADSGAISGTAVSNIKGNGYNVFYDSSASANSYLGGKTYTLVGGGYLKPAGSSSSNAPAIATGGVVNGASYVAGVAPAAWVSIFGSNLSSTTAAVGDSDMVNGYLPTTFKGTSVTINGKAAYMYYVSPGQINVQAPSDTSTGTVTATVTTSEGSASATVTLQAVQPGLFTTSDYYVLAVRPSDSTIINGSGAATPGYSTAAAARTGDVLELYVNALGTTTTTVPAGLAFSGGNYPTTSTPTVTFGGTQAEVLYSGLVGTGLYQVNVKVPASLTAGTYSVVVTQDGVSSPLAALMKIVTN